MWVPYYKTSAVSFIEFTDKINVSFSNLQCNTDPCIEPSNVYLTKAYLPEKKPTFIRKHQVLANL